MKKLIVPLLAFTCLIACKKEPKVDEKAEIVKNLNRIPLSK